ncbi:MAG: TOBE domain-containing protein [Cyclobacteriaceae bacterium]|nr:TOBE domain-containing protein [Cyclobacteriaceae bacterium]
MNSLKGKVETLNVYENLTLAKIRVGEVLVTSIVIETPETCPYLVVGKEVNVLFKENEVIIGKGDDLSISLQNRFKCTIKHIEKGILLSKLTLATQGTEIFSIITTNAVKQLELEEGMSVQAMIKTNEILLSE